MARVDHSILYDIHTGKNTVSRVTISAEGLKLTISQLFKLSANELLKDCYACAYKIRINEYNTWNTMFDSYIDNNIIDDMSVNRGAVMDIRRLLFTELRHRARTVLQQLASPCKDT